MQLGIPKRGRNGAPRAAITSFRAAACTLGFSKFTNSIIPDMFEYAWKA